MDGSFRIVKKRTTLKLSTHLSPDEVREAVANAMGIEPGQVPDFDPIKALEEIKNQSSRVNDIIRTHKTALESNPKTTKDKYEELHDIGKFILASGDQFKIYTPDLIPTYPDFTLTYGNYKIGVEHTRLMSEEIKATIKTASFYIKKAEAIIAKDLSQLSKTVNIFVDYTKGVIGNGNFKNRRFTQQEREQIPHIFATYIRSELTGGNISKPDFISQVQITSNQDYRVDLELAESYFTEEEFSALLLEKIGKKEAKADNYRKACCVNELWLIIIIDDVNSFSGFNLENGGIPKIESSNFERVLLFEKFGGIIYSLFSKTV